MLLLLFYFIPFNVILFYSILLFCLYLTLGIVSLFTMLKFSGDKLYFRDRSTERGEWEYNYNK